MSELESLVRRLYTALLAGDAATVDNLLAADFEGHVAEGLPLGIGGAHHGPAAMRDEVWWTIGRRIDVDIHPTSWIPCADGRLLVLGRYVGKGRRTDAPLDAAFAHLFTARGGRITALWQLTDTIRWPAALGVETT